MRNSIICCLLFIYFLPERVLCYSLTELKIATSESDTTIKKNQLFIYPIAFYLPETKWGGGTVGLYNFRFKGDKHTCHPSTINFSLGYTQNKQVIITMPFELYYKENTYKLKGELSYFKWQYYFYGIGNDSQESDFQTFGADYPKVEVEASHRFGNFYLGVKYRFDYTQIKRVQSGTLLDRQDYTGEQGGFTSGLGFVAQLDTRDYIYNPTRGWFVVGDVYRMDKKLGSDFQYTRLSADISTFIELHQNHILALQMNTINIIGNAPFYDIAFMGSPKYMRGLKDRRLIDNNLFAIQAEYRYPIYKRLHGVAFFGGGDVAHKYWDLFTNKLTFTYGAGLRFVLNEQDRVRVRLDYGRTFGLGHGFYLTINDAF